MAPITSRLIATAAALVLLLQSSPVAIALPTHARPAKIIERGELLDAYDFIVVGAGTAGLTVADRLTESGEYDVLVVEYGYLDDSPAITQVLGPARGFGAGGGDSSSDDDDENPVTFYSGATRMYNVTSTPQDGLDGRPKAVSAGAVVGGSSAVNGMVFDRGSAEDYDSWVWAAGGDDDELGYGKIWGWDNLLPAFKKSVTFHPPTEDMVEQMGITYDVEAAYGGDTPIHSSYRPFQWPTMLKMFDAFREIDNLTFPVEAAGGDATGVFWFPNSMDPETQTRSYSRLGHYGVEGGPAYRSNFHMLTGHRVVRVGVSGELGPNDDSLAAHGVYIMPRDGPVPDDPWKVRAKKEIVVSAGAIHTPQVLQRSGIGPVDVLEAAGVDVKVELPGVGWNFQDHMVWSMGWRFQTSITPNQTTLYSDPEFQELAQTLWETNKTGPYTSYVNAGAFLPLSTMSHEAGNLVAQMLAQDPAEFFPEGTHPSIINGYATQMRAAARQYSGTKSALLEMPFSGGSSFSVVLLKILSRGRIYISPEDDWQGQGEMEPIVDYRSWTNPLDGKFCAVLAKWVRWFMSTPAMVEMFDPVETSPGLEAVPDDEDMEENMMEWIRGRVSPSVAHPVGTAALGTVERGGVLRPDLRVHNVMRLSVADNSIMPLIPGTHTSSTAYAIGEKAAELILERAQDPCRMHPMDWTEDMGCVENGGWGTHAVEPEEW